VAERADAARNRQVILAAAGRLFDEADDPGAVSMDVVARAAGVGKGTLFRRFGDRITLLRAVYEARLAVLWNDIESGSPPLGPDTEPPERILAILDSIVEFKVDVPGSYILVDHSLGRLQKGAAGYLEVEGAADPTVFEPIKVGSGGSGGH